MSYTFLHVTYFYQVSRVIRRGDRHLVLLDGRLMILRAENSKYPNWVVYLSGATIQVYLIKFNVTCCYLCSHLFACLG